MHEKNLLPTLQEECRARNGGTVIDKGVKPEILTGLPEHMREIIASGGNVIIDLSGGVTLQTNVSKKC